MIPATERLDLILNTLEPERAEALIELRARLREEGIPRDLDMRLDAMIDELLDEISRLRSRTAAPRLTRSIPLLSAVNG
jgi:hypothetical protein